MSVRVSPDWAYTFTVMLTVKVALSASDEAVQTTLPLVAPAAGVVHDPGEPGRVQWAGLKVRKRIIGI